MKTLLFFFSLAMCSAVYAASTVSSSPKTSIVGNPINRQDDFTINADSSTWADVSCVFTNSGTDPVELNIWTKPTAKAPLKTIKLEPASKLKPIHSKVNFRFQLEKHWWCTIYTPKGQSEKNKWLYCTYFSISDSTIAEYRPFSNFDKTVYSKQSSYHCRITNPSKHINFFYFK